MTEPKGQLIKGDDLEILEGSSSFAALLREEGDDIRRDVFMLLNPGDSVSGRLQAGITIVYPGCSTRGHSHADQEEVYFFTRGGGIMGVDGEEWEVKAGDTFYVGWRYLLRQARSIPYDAQPL
jgi:mannose-6-phosphate isomerase-like protein (cupin superfamily)